MIKYIKRVLWRAAKPLSYVEDAQCLKINEISPALADDIYLYRLYKCRWKSVRTASHQTEIWTGNLITKWLKWIYYYNFMDNLATALKRKRIVVDLFCQSSRNLSQCLLKHHAVKTRRGEEAYEQFLFLTALPNGNEWFCRSTFVTQLCGILGGLRWSGRRAKGGNFLRCINKFITEFRKV